MCLECGQVFCPTNCPSYDPQYDPWVSGFCERCGVALYEDGTSICSACEEDEQSTAV